MNVVLLFVLPIFLIIIFLAYVFIVRTRINEEKKLQYINKNLSNEFSRIRIKEGRFCIKNTGKSKLSQLMNEAMQYEIENSILCYAKITNDNVIIVRYINKVNKKTIRVEEYTDYGLFLSMFEFI